MKHYEFRFASASTSNKATPDIHPPSTEPGWKVHSWQVLDVNVTPLKQGTGMRQQTTPGSTNVQLLVLWEREVHETPSDQPVMTGVAG